MHARNWVLRGPILGLVLLTGSQMAILSCVHRGPDGGEPSHPQDAPRHVFLITVDTLRADHTSAYGYPRTTTPFLERLSKQGVLFEHPIVQWPKTGPSFASMFTGRYPQTTGLTHRAALTLPEPYLTLAELFQQSGFTTLAVVSNAVLGKGQGWSQGFDEYIETWSEAETFPEDPYAYRIWMNAGRVNELAHGLLERHRESERIFLWLHYSDPHAPYVLPPGFSNPFLEDEHYTGKMQVLPSHLRNRELDGQRELRYYVAHYDANVLVADRAIAEALHHAEGLGLLDQALVIYTSDHGESLGEHASFFVHGPLPYNTTARVPLVFFAPRYLREQRSISQAVGLIDLYPTLKEWLAPEADAVGLEGESLLPLLRGEKASSPQDAYVFAEAGKTGEFHFRSLQSAFWKLVYHPARKRREKEEAPFFELYQLDRDPLETVNLVTKRPDQLDLLRRALRRRSGGEGPPQVPQGSEEITSREAQKALRALGYID